MGTTAAHRALERVADGTCTQVWTWMTNKCRRRINGGGVYIYSIKDIPEKKKEGVRKASSWEARGAGSSPPRTRSPFSLGHKAV